MYRWTPKFKRAQCTRATNILCPSLVWSTVSVSSHSRFRQQVWFEDILSWTYTHICLHLTQTQSSEVLWKVIRTAPAEVAINCPISRSTTQMHIKCWLMKHKCACNRNCDIIHENVYTATWSMIIDPPSAISTLNAEIFIKIRQMSALYRYH